VIQQDQKNYFILYNRKESLMIKILVGIFIILHGLVHMLYFGHSARFFELQPGLTWPDGSWAFSSLFGNETTRLIASIVCVLVAIGFVAGGIGIFAEQAWWLTVVVGTAIFSTLFYLLLWNGKFDKLDSQGGIAILINLAVIAALLLQWPKLDF
jgi:hypothetical protein